MSGFVLAVAFFATVLGIMVYARIARALGIVAVPNERTLHAKPTVRGAGIVIALVFSIHVLARYLGGELSCTAFVPLFAGGGAIAILGMIDDVVQLSTRMRLMAHLGGALLAVAVIGEPFGLGWLGLAFVVLALVWMINLYNFMDGIDGMAASGGMFVGIAAGLFLWNAGSSFSLLPLVLGTASLGFLMFNWPPARLFMGDSGSGFYGYAFGVIALLTIHEGTLSLWTWIILLGYFVGDTTTTLAIRIATVRRFWGTHRSHAYQNLARIWSDHRRMTLLVIVVEVVWLLPIAAASVACATAGPALAAIALAPIVLFAFKYGPRHGA